MPYQKNINTVWLPVAAIFGVSLYMIYFGYPVLGVSPIILGGINLMSIQRDFYDIVMTSPPFFRYVVIITTGIMPIVTYIAIPLLIKCVGWFFSPASFKQTE